MDKIRLNAVACLCKVGVPAWERAKRQKILLDLELVADLRTAGRTDALKDAIDYFAIETAVRKRAESAAFKLLERLAEVLAKTVLDFDRRIKSATVTVRKKPAVMPHTREVSVTLQRTRSSRARRSESANTDSS